MNKILLVDDNEDFLGLVKAVLRGSFEVDTATTAEMGMKMSEENVYNAVVLDVSLPDYTGYYLGTFIRKNLPKIPIAFLTAYDGDVTRENAETMDAQFWRKSDMVMSSKNLIKNVTDLCK